MKQLSLFLSSRIGVASNPADFWRLRYDGRSLPLIDIQIEQYSLEKPAANSSLKITQQTLHRLLISNISFNHVNATVFKPWGLTIGSELFVNEVLGLFHKRRIMMDFKNNRLLDIPESMLYISH